MREDRGNPREGTSASSDHPLFGVVEVAQAIDARDPDDRTALRTGDRANLWPFLGEPGEP